MRKSTQLRLSAGSFAIGLAMAATPSFAQDTETEEADVDGEAIIVTGSRVTDPNLQLTTPVAAVGEEELTLRQTNTAEQFLRELPAAVPSIGSAVNNGNGGSSFVNLRGVGSQRNLVLLDGRRFVPADTTGRVDLNSIPLAVIERTDILTGGATTTYGADAVSGVVNFITKRDFAGLEANVSSGITERGDGETYRVELTMGANFDDGRGNAVLSIGYQDQEQVLQGDREFSETAIDSFAGTVTGSGNTIPNNFFVAAQGPLDADGNVTGTTFLGQTDPENDSFAPGFNGGAGPFNFNPFNIFQTPFERFNIYGSANYEVSDAVEIYSQAVFSKQTVSTIIAPGGSFFNTYALNLNNPFLTSGAARALCGPLALDDVACEAAVTTPFGATLADGTPNPDYAEVNGLFPRRSVEAGTRESDFTSTLFNIVAGARGGITDNISWDISATYGESERIQIQTGFARFERLQNALIAIPDASAPNGAVCAQSQTAGTTNDGLCVPINIFGALGTITPDSIDYVFSLTQQVITSTTIGTVNGIITGDLDTGLLESPVSFAVGAEYREYTAQRRSDEASQTPGAVVGGGGAAPDITGDYDVFDAYGELYIPLLEGRSFAESLLLEIGGRYSNYSTAGTEFTWKVGGSWEPTIGLTFRGNYQRSSRAPNIGELFTPVVTGLGNLQTDPCQLDLPVGDAALTAVCIAQGAPASTIGVIQPPIAGQANQTTGGNPDLGVETADTWTVGALIRPDALPGFSFTIDYWNIRVEDAVSAPAINDINSGCFVAGPVDFDNNVFCQLIARSPTTGSVSGGADEVQGFILQQSNLGLIETDGIDVSIRYGTDISDDVALNISIDGTWTNENVFTAFPGALARDCVGFFSNACGSIQPEYNFNTRASFTFWDEFTASLRWRYLSGVEQEPDDIENVNGPALIGPAPALDGEVVNFQEIPAESYFDLSLQWDVSENVLFTFTVTNLLDNDPEIVGFNIGSTAFNSGNVFPSTYDPLGRRYNAGVRFSF